MCKLHVILSYTLLLLQRKNRKVIKTQNIIKQVKFPKKIPFTYKTHNNKVYKDTLITSYKKKNINNKKRFILLP